ncbi:MAG TPA: hypothetical protein PKK43_14310, partial [Spirochaetota bacterium]|nr:hypothetical protein [Spirochaetota bacterium]
DISVMFNQAAKLQASGCTSDKCTLDLASMVYANEIIYGRVSKQKKLITLDMRNLTVGEDGAKSAVKSVVHLTFSDTQSEWFCREAGLKLIDPSYRIYPGNAPLFSGKIDAGSITLVPLKGSDVKMITFKTNDSNIQKYVDSMSDRLAKGDSQYAKKKYADARKTYNDILSTLQGKLSDKTLERMNEYVEEVKTRADYTVCGELFDQISIIDRELKAQGNPSVEDLRKIYGKYAKLRDDMYRLDLNYMASLHDVVAVLEPRLKTLGETYISIREKEGDSLYGQYRFPETIAKYYDASKFAHDNEDYLSPETVTRVTAKYEMAFETGRSYLWNIVNSLLDQSEYYNLNNKNKDMLRSMQKARNAMSGPLHIFVTEDTIRIFNGVAKKMNGVTSINEDWDPLIYIAIKRPYPESLHY